MTRTPKPRPHDPLRGREAGETEGLGAHLLYGSPAEAPTDHELVGASLLEAPGLLGSGLLGAGVPVGLYQGGRPEELEEEVESPAPVRHLEVEAPSSWRADALRAAARLKSLGLVLKTEVRVEAPDPSWGWTPNCTSEAVLAHLTSGAVPKEDLLVPVGLPEGALDAALSTLTAQGLVVAGRGGLKATAQGKAVIAYRLVDLMPDQAVALGAAQLFGANLALQAGSLDSRGYAQAILNLVNRGSDAERRLALLYVAGLTAEEAATSLEPGTARPEALDDLAAYLRWTIPPELRPVAEDPLDRLQGAQSLSDHWAALQEVRAQGPSVLKAYTSSPDSYAFAKHGTSLATLRSASALSLSVMESEGGVSALDAAGIAQAVLAAAAGEGMEPHAPLHIDQALAVVSPVVAIKALLGMEGRAALAQSLQANRQEAIALAHQVARPMLAAHGYDQESAALNLEAVISSLGHALRPEERGHLADALAGASRIDQGTAAMVQPLLKAANGNEQRLAITALALSLAESDALRSGPGDEQFASMIRVLGLLANGADAENLERIHHAAALLAVHPLASPEEQREAQGLAATSRTLLVSVAGVLPAARDRSTLARELGETSSTPAEVLDTLRFICKGEEFSLKASLPWPETLPDANLAAFVEHARLGELRAALSLDAIQSSWVTKAPRAAGGPKVAGSAFLLPTSALDPSGVHGLAFVRSLANREPFSDYGLFLLAEQHMVGNLKAYGVFVVDAEEDLPRVVEMCRLNEGSCKLVKLGDNVPRSLVDQAKEALGRAGVAYSAFEISDEELAEAYATTA